MMRGDTAITKAKDTLLNHPLSIATDARLVSTCELLTRQSTHFVLSTGLALNPFFQTLSISNSRHALKAEMTARSIGHCKKLLRLLSNGWKSGTFE